MVTQTFDRDRTPAEARAWLVEIGELAKLLPEVLTTGIRSGGSGGGRPAPGPKPPVSVDLLALTMPPKPDDDTWEAGMDLVDPDGAGILPYLWGWCRDLEGTLYECSPQLPDEVPAEPDLDAVISWLCVHAEMCVELWQWSDFVWGVRTIRKRLSKALGGAGVGKGSQVPCKRCGGVLERQGEAFLWQCSEGHAVSVQAVTLREAAKIIGISARTLQDWASREPDLHPVLAESGSRRVYDLAELRALVARHRLRHAA